MYTHSFHELDMRHGDQALCQYVGHLLLSGSVGQLDPSVLHDLVQEMIANVDVFGAVVELGVL